MSESQRNRRALRALKVRPRAGKPETPPVKLRAGVSSCGIKQCVHATVIAIRRSLANGMRKPRIMWPCQREAA